MAPTAMIRMSFWILVPETTKHGAKMVKLLLPLAVLLSIKKPKTTSTLQRLNCQLLFCVNFSHFLELSSRLLIQRGGS
jgi:hypothetical protein